MTRRWPRRCLWVVLVVAPVLARAAQTPAPDQIERGRQIYVEGTSPAGGEIVAVLGEGIEVGAAAVPCAGCHGHDGRGRPEGGLTPTDITWDRLARAYGAVAPGGRRHPPYDALALERSLVDGIDPGGTPFHSAMPRYRMGREDMADLVAYLQTLGRETDPGLGASTLRIGVLLPGGETGPGMAEAVRAVLLARTAAFNAAGGSYGRAIELRFLEASGVRASRLAHELATQPVFAALAVARAGVDDDLAALSEERGLPLISPFGPPGTLPDGRYVFALLPGLEAQARGLVHAARGSAGETPSPLLLAPDDARLDAAVAAALQAAAEWRALSVRRYARSEFGPATLARELAAAGVDAVLFLGSGEEALALLEAAGPLAWRPRLYVAGAAGSALLAAPAAFADLLFAALPAPPRLSPLAATRYRALSVPSALPDAHLSAQVLALAAAEVLFEALTRTGRDLTRERLVESLEGLQRFETAYLPPLSFGPGRRVGTGGVYLARIDPATRTFAAAGGWVETP